MNLKTSFIASICPVSILDINCSLKRYLEDGVMSDAPTPSGDFEISVNQKVKRLYSSVIPLNLFLNIAGLVDVFPSFARAVFTFMSVKVHGWGWVGSRSKVL